jgi:hypothetical protein
MMGNQRKIVEWIMASARLGRGRELVEAIISRLRKPSLMKIGPASGLTVV